MRLTAALSLISSAAIAFDPAAGDFARPAGNLVRVMTWNVLDNFIATPALDATFKRVIEAANPDVISFQEIDTNLAGSASAISAMIKARLETYSPAYTWNVWVGSSDGDNRNALCSRYPISLTRTDTLPASDTRGVTMALVDLPNATFAADLYVMAVHFKCCGTTGVGGDYQRRQIYADAITNWMRDARTAGGNITLAANTPMLTVGDTNLGGGDDGDEAPYHPARTMLDGSIFDTATYGASSAPDWDGSNSTDAAPYDWNNAQPRTHSSTTPSSRFDRFFYTDSAMRQVGGCVLNTSTMTAAALSASGLQAGDTSSASDHLPAFVDFALGADSAAPGKLLVNEFCANDVSTDDRTFLEIKNVGGREINLDAPVDYRLKLSNSALPTTPPAAENENSDFDIKGIVPAGGLFVMYSSTGDSVAVAGTIVTNLPNKLQRHDFGNVFFLTNADNVAFALVQQGKSDISTTSETVVEAYGYAAPSPGTTRYFRTDSGNALTIALGAPQWTSFNSGSTASDLSLSRNPGNTVSSNYAGWTLGATATPGLPNAAPTRVNEWSLY